MICFDFFLLKIMLTVAKGKIQNFLFEFAYDLKVGIVEGIFSETICYRNFYTVKWKHVYGFHLNIYLLFSQLYIQFYIFNGIRNRFSAQNIYFHSMFTVRKTSTSVRYEYIIPRPLSIYRGNLILRWFKLNVGYFSRKLNVQMICSAQVEKNTINEDDRKNYKIKIKQSQCHSF